MGIISYFNSRPSARGDLHVAHCVYDCHYFNSRPSARGDPLTATAVLSISYLFQFTPLREGRQAQTVGFLRRWYFNSRPSARGDSMQYNMSIRKIISIHAPPRGATFYNLDHDTAFEFQFTPLREGRPRLKARIWVFSAISIHAPPRGATSATCQKTGALIFQFTPLREGRQARRNRPPSKSDFNSRPSARGDKQGNGQPTTSVNFNSRPSARGDFA